MCQRIVFQQKIIQELLQPYAKIGESPYPKQPSHISL
jgi:hypothetical protein